MDEKQKELFVKLTHFLGEVLGKNYEIVFHIISAEGSYIAAIANNHISKRTINSPLTDFASKLLQEKAYLKQDFLCNYKALTQENKLLQGSTFFIKQGQELVGILCINHDTSELCEAVHKIIELENLSGFEGLLAQSFGGGFSSANAAGIASASFSSANATTTSVASENSVNFTSVGALNLENGAANSSTASAFAANASDGSRQISIENLSLSIEDILAQHIDLNYLKSGFTLSTKQKGDIIKTLYDKGIFNIKGSLYQVAKLLNISEPSVYRYLNKLKKE